MALPHKSLLIPQLVKMYLAVINYQEIKSSNSVPITVYICVYTQAELLIILGPDNLFYFLRSANLQLETM